MKKRNKALVVMLALTMVFTCGCSVGSGRKPVTDANKYLSSANGGESANTIDYNGTININLPLETNEFGEKALKAVAAKYEELHPETTVNVTPWASESYASEVNSILMGTTVPKADIVQTYTIDSNYLPTKFVDYKSYITKNNPYDNDKWMNVLDQDAYQLSSDKSGIYNLCLSTNMSFFVYNKSIWAAAGLTESDIPTTWDKFVSVCSTIKNKTSKIPIALSGGNATSGPISWLMNVYTDQYYRSVVEDSHAIDGDYCYNIDVDANWEYDVTDKNNDSSSKYTLNDLRFFNLVMTNRVSASDAKFQGMLKNFQKLIPQYCQNNYASANQLQAENDFWKGDAAIIYHTGEVFNVYKEKMSQSGFSSFEYGTFFAPPMSGNGTEAPDSTETRSVGGAVGWYGVIKKDKKQNDLVMDFMMYWGSSQGQKVYYDKIAEMGAYASGNTLVKTYELSSSVYPGKDMDFPGLCHSNPMGNFWGGLVNTSGELTTFQLFNEYTTKVLAGSLSLTDYANNLMTAIKSGIPDYLEKLGWRRNAWETPSTNPKL